MFDQDGADDKLKEWLGRHRGQRVFFLFERTSRRASRRCCRPRRRAVFRVLDEQNNKFTLAVAQTLMVHRRAPWPPAGARFVELGGVVPTVTADRVLLEAILASGDFLPGLLFADVGQLATLAADPWLRRPKPPALIARAVRRPPA